MARLSREEKADMVFFINSDGEIKYHKKCLRCKHKCKQSFRCVDVYCPRYERR